MNILKNYSNQISKEEIDNTCEIAIKRARKIIMKAQKEDKKRLAKMQAELNKLKEKINKMFYQIIREIESENTCEILKERDRRIIMEAQKEYEIELSEMQAELNKFKEESNKYNEEINQINEEINKMKEEAKK